MGVTDPAPAVMSRLTRIGAALMASLMVLAVGAPAVAAHDAGTTISVDEADSTYTVTVEHNDSAVDNASVNVTATNASNSSYSASGDTGPNGTVTFDLPENETEVNITATFENHSATETFVLSGANDSDGNDTAADDPFGLRLTSWLHNLITDPANGTILGQSVSEFVTANNPGSEHRSDKANPGGNATGPPEHAVNKSAGNNSGPPDHAVNKSDAKGNSSGNGGNSSSDNGNGGDKGQGNSSLARAEAL